MPRKGWCHSEKTKKLLSRIRQEEIENGKRPQDNLKKWRENGGIPWNKGLKGFMEGEVHGMWTPIPSYRSLHLWVERKLGKPNRCEKCGLVSEKKRQFHWANKSHLYKRLISDWIRLCVKCHKAYDRK